MDTRTVESWEEALTLARALGAEKSVTVPKSAEPALPTDIDLRRSNFPWSIHKGAVSVYREHEQGEHLQVREYPTSWAVSIDHYNPHYHPVEHATVDIPAHMVIAMGALTPIRGYRWIFGDRLPSPAAGIAFTTAAVGMLPKLGRSLLP